MDARDGRWRRFEPLPARRIPEDATKPTHHIEAEARRLARQEAARSRRGEVLPRAVAGVSPRSLPPSWSSCEVVGRELLEGVDVPISGGLVGAAQDADGLTLAPAVAWVVEASPAPALWRVFEGCHAVVRRDTAAKRPDAALLPPLRGAMRSFYRRYERATLFEGAAEILPREHILRDDFDDGLGVRSVAPRMRDLARHPLFELMTSS